MLTQDYNYKENSKQFNALFPEIENASFDSIGERFDDLDKLSFGERASKVSLNELNLMRNELLTLDFSDYSEGLTSLEATPEELIALWLEYKDNPDLRV